MRKRLKGSEAENARLFTPSAITLPMPEEMLDGARANRIQKRTIKSTRLGELSIDYETGISSSGVKTTPKELRLIAAPGMTFAYDTILFVTLLRYVHLMRREEIQSKILMDHYFKISTGSISELSFMGLAYLEQCHFSKAKKLAELYGKGCFIIHLDGTNEGGMYTHFVVREGIRGNVLRAEKIISESADAIKPILKKVKEHFGTPDAIVSDMSAPIGNAVKAVFKGVPRRLCHYHFLKAIGKTLLSDKHEPIMISVKRMKETLNAKRKELKDKLNSFQRKKRRDGGKDVKKREDRAWLISLIDYINDYQKDLSGEGFPFDLPALAFYKRCETAFDAMEKILNDPGKNISGEVNITMYFN